MSEHSSDNEIVGYEELEESSAEEHGHSSLSSVQESQTSGWCSHSDCPSYKCLEQCLPPRSYLKCKRRQAEMGKGSSR